MPGLGESRSARRALRSVSAAASGSPIVAWTGASAARRVELLGPGGASPGEDHCPLEPLARRLQVARGRVQLTRHRGGQRPHPVLLERLLGTQHVGGRHPRSRPVEITRREGGGREGPLRAEHGQAVCARPGDPHSLLEHRHHLVGWGAAEVPCRSECGQRHGAPGRIGPALQLDCLRAECLGGSEVAGPVGHRRAQHCHARRDSGATLEQRAPVVRRGRRVRPALGGGGLARVEGKPGPSQAQARVARDQVHREGVEPANHRCAAAALKRPVPRRRNQVGRHRSLPCREQVGDGSRHVALAGKPGTGAGVQLDVGTPPKRCPRAPGGGHRERRGGSETTRGARPEVRERGWPARSCPAAPSSCPRRVRHRRAPRRSGRARRCRGGTRAPRGPGPTAPRRRDSPPGAGRIRARRPGRVPSGRAATGRPGRARPPSPRSSR